MMNEDYWLTGFGHFFFLLIGGVVSSDYCCDFSSGRRPKQTNEAEYLFQDKDGSDEKEMDDLMTLAYLYTLVYSEQRKIATAGSNRNKW